MNRISFAVVIAWMITVPHLQAQSFRGGFGHLYFGPAWNISQNFEDQLRGRSALGSELSIVRLEMLNGGGGYGLFPNGLLIGGSGMGYTVRDATVRGQVKMSMGSGALHVGYLTTRRRNVLGFPYIGVGGYETKAEIKNTTTGEPIWVGNQQVPSGEYLYLHNQGMSVELGYSLQVLTFSVPDYGSMGGFIVGLQIGGYFFVGTEDWHDDSTDELLLDFSRPFAIAPYLRLSIGGGGFSVMLSKHSFA